MDIFEPRDDRDQQIKVLHLANVKLMEKYIDATQALEEALKEIEILKSIRFTRE